MNKNMKPIFVNLFRLHIAPNSLRIWCYKHPQPEKQLNFLRNKGWHAEIRADEVWVYGADGIDVPEVGASLRTNSPKGVLETTKAFNSHLKRHLAKKGFYRIGATWLDPEDYVEIEGQMAVFGTYFPLTVRMSQGYLVETMRYGADFFAQVDLQKQVFTQKPLASLDGAIVTWLETQSAKHKQPLRAIDLRHKRIFLLDKAPPEAHLLLHPSHLEAIHANTPQNTRRASQDVFKKSQFSFEELIRKIGVFEGILDPNPLPLPQGALAQVGYGGLRMSDGTGKEAKDVFKLGFLKPLRKTRFQLAFPALHVPLKQSQNSAVYSNHILVKERNQASRRESVATYQKNTLSVEARQLMLYHFVDRPRLKASQEGQQILKLLSSKSSFTDAWRRLGFDLELVTPPILYDPKTGKLLSGSAQRTDVLLLLAPEEVAQKQLENIYGQTKGFFKKLQIVQPSTLMDSPASVNTLAYDIALKLGAVPFKLEGFDTPVLGIRRTKEGFSWRLLSAEGVLEKSGKDLPEEGELPDNLLVHFMGAGDALEEIMAWTSRPLVWISRSNLRFSEKQLPLGTYFRLLPEVAYLLTHPGTPGWPSPVRVEVVQGEVTLEEALALVYWLTKAAGGLYLPGHLPLSIKE